MIYFIKPIEWSHWLVEFYENLDKWFKELGRETKMVWIEELIDISKQDCLILLDHRHIWNDFLDSLKVIKTTHQHSTACIPSYFQNDFEQEKYYTSRKDYVTISNTNFVIKEMNKLLSPYNLIEKAWFPLDFKSYPKFKIKRDEKLVVIAWRLSNDKQHILGLTFLKDLVAEWYKCIFSTLDNEQNKEIYTNQNLKFFELHWVEIQFNNKEQFYKLLSKANYFVSVSLPETLGLSVVEAIHYGCKIYVPYWDNSYTELVDDWYFPYSYRSLLRSIKHNMEVKTNIKWLDYKVVSKRYLEIIDYNINKYKCITE